jgi:hypothetical protein
MNQKMKKLGILVTVAVLASLAVTGILVFAQSSSSASTAAASTVATSSFLSKVAQNLGIDEAKLEAAVQSAHEQSIDEALAAGRITEEQATAMKERLAAQRAMGALVAEGIASGRITQEQADLLGGRGAGGLRDGRGHLSPGREAGQRAEEACHSAGQGMGR